MDAKQEKEWQPTMDTIIRASVEGIDKAVRSVVSQITEITAETVISHPSA